MNIPKFRIYPSIGIARVGNGKATKEEVIFSPEVPWKNLFDTETDYIADDGSLKKMAQRFYIYKCNEKGEPVEKIDLTKYKVEWHAEVANKKPFWYEFNNCLDLSVQLDNHQNISKNFFDNKISPGISAGYRNPNVINEGLRIANGENFRKDLVNNPDKVTVASGQKEDIIGSFPFKKSGEESRIAESLGVDANHIKLATVEYDEGSLIFYAGDGVSASLNPSDLNTDFADNSNWYDDICDGRITATLTAVDSGEKIYLDNAESAAWIATAPPDYAPQIQPIATMYDLICGTDQSNKELDGNVDLSLVFTIMYRLYRMQWVNQGDFLSPSFREVIDSLQEKGLFHHIYDNSESAKKVRNSVFQLFRNPDYDYDNEPVIPSKNQTDMTNIDSGTEALKFPSYPGDGINYPGSPAQWFAVPPLLYSQLEKWRDGDFVGIRNQDFTTIDELGRFYQQKFIEAAVDTNDEGKSALLMTRAVLETLYGGGFHPGVELTWPMRHRHIYAENTLTSYKIYDDMFEGLREIRLNSATRERQEAIFYNDFGYQMSAQDVTDSMQAGNEKSWLWEMTPGDLTKWMGIPWQSDAGSCQLVFIDSEYPIPAWWAANLPVTVLTQESLEKIQDDSILESTRQYIYAQRIPWLHTTDTGFVGYHAEGGYRNGLINMVYHWKDIGVVTGRKTDAQIDGVPDIVYVSTDSKNRRNVPFVFLGKEILEESVGNNAKQMFYENSVTSVYIPKDKRVLLSSNKQGTGEIRVDDEVYLFVEGNEVYHHDFSNDCSGYIASLDAVDITELLQGYQGKFVDLKIAYHDKCGDVRSASKFYMVFK